MAALCVATICTASMASTASPGPMASMAAMAAFTESALPFPSQSLVSTHRVTFGVAVLPRWQAGGNAQDPANEKAGHALTEEPRRTAATGAFLWLASALVDLCMMLRRGFVVSFSPAKI
jgi:hypothetical protein